MPLSKVNKSSLTGESKKDRKRRCSDLNQPTLSPGFVQHKKLKQDIKTPVKNMTDSQKKANFSALNTHSNGFNKSPVVNSKPGSAKKLTIKNFKGEKLSFFVFYVLSGNQNCIFLSKCQ